MIFNSPSKKQSTIMLIGLFATVILLLACYTHAATPTMVNLDSVSTRASLKLVPIANLETLSSSSSDQNSKNHHRIELRTHLGRGFSLDIETNDDETFMGGDYEEIIHDVSKQTNPHEPHLTVISRKEHTKPVHRCTYHGRVSGDKRSVVSINTCSGQISGMIHLSNGELFSIEPVERITPQSTRHTKTNAPIRTLSLSSLRELALQGDLVSLADNHSEVVLVDVNGESKLVDEAEKRLNGDNIGALSNNVDGADKPSPCASGAENHPPVHILRKIGYTDADIDSLHQEIEQQNNNDDTSNINIQQSDDEKTEQQDDEQPQPKPIRYVEVVLYHDYARLKRFNTTEGMTQRDIIDAARADGIELFNNVRAYYLQSNFDYQVVMSLKGHVFFNAGDPYLKYLSNDRKILVTSGRGLLENFNKYRYSYGHSNHDIGMLLSGNTFQANIMGVANVGSLCSSARYNGNINSVNYRNIVKSSVLSAHENGHVLNSQHDSRPGYIMNPYVSEDIGFSPQSVRAINSHLSRTSCTINAPRSMAIDNNTTQQFSRGIGILSTGQDNTNNNSDEYQSVANVSFIYTDNIHAGDRFDYVDEKLVTDSWFKRAEFSLPDDEAIVHTNIPHNLELLANKGSKSGLSTTSIVLIALGAAGLACALTTMVILFVLRHLLHDKTTRDFFVTKQINNDASILDNTTVQLPPQQQSKPQQQRNTNTTQIVEQPLTLRTNSLEFTPQAKTHNFAMELSPNTPHIAPASPSYSETVRMRRTSLPQISDAHEDQQK